jgi:hypothetical protein
MRFFDRRIADRLQIALDCGFWHLSQFATHAPQCRDGQPLGDSRSLLTVRFGDS